MIGLIGCRIRKHPVPFVQDQCPEATAEIFYWYSVCGMIAMIAARPNSPCSPRCTLTMNSSVEPLFKLNHSSMIIHGFLHGFPELYTFMASSGIWSAKPDDTIGTWDAPLRSIGCCWLTWRSSQPNCLMVWTLEKVASVGIPTFHEAKHPRWANESMGFASNGATPKSSKSLDF